MQQPLIEPRREMCIQLGSDVAAGRIRLCQKIGFALSQRPSRPKQTRSPLHARSAGSACTEIYITAAS